MEGLVPIRMTKDEYIASASQLMVEYFKVTYPDAVDIYGFYDNAVSRVYVYGTHAGKEVSSSVDFDDDKVEPMTYSEKRALAAAVGVAVATRGK